MSNALRMGVLGPGGIVRRVYRDFCCVDGLEITAVGSRSLERARQAAQAYGAKHAFGSYEELAACGEVDLIYIATPHNFHMEQAILCMEHGKHVLCEKPMALNDVQTQAMIDCARRNNVFLMEAMWSRLFPAACKFRELLGDGVIGKLRHSACDFSFYIDPNPESRLFSPNLAGGSLLDVGIYAMAATSMVFGPDPVRVVGLCQKADTGVDIMTAVTAQYAGGETAQMLTGFCAKSAQSLTVFGEQGRMELPDFWHPTRVIVTDNAGNQRVYQFEAEYEGFRHEFAHVRDCVRQGLKESPVMPLLETLKLSRIMTNLRREWGIRYPEEA